MNNFISGNALRDRILGEMNRELVPAPEVWVQALAAPGNRELLAAIASRRPQSIGALSEMAGRAHSNVSRSLSALIRAGLVEVRPNGRASVPELTVFGRDKVAELRLAASDERGAEADADADDRSFLSVRFNGQSAGEDDVVDGEVLAAFTERGRAEPTVACSKGDVNEFALWVLDHWWRLLYRRDAPMKLGVSDFVDSGDRCFSVAFKSMGGHIERTVRTSNNDALRLERKSQEIALEDCESQLLEWVVRPVVSRMKARCRFDRPVQAKLARLEDTLANSQELLFARTAGALGSSAYNLDDMQAENVRKLIGMIPDEDARLDFASAVLNEQVSEASAWVREEMARHGGRNRLVGLPDMACELRPQLGKDLRRYQRGTEMARLVRGHLGLAADASIGSAVDLHALFGDRGFESSPDAPGELRAFQSVAADAPTVVMGDEGPGANFTLARAIGDYLVFGTDTSCVADLYTERQAVGRAFAAELIAPRDGVVRMIEEEEQSVSQVARHYCTSQMVVRHQWENNR
ncbi:helix-turn-helix domain-containing protein [Azospirillum sp. Vi22]|uniref:HVO_A0114 family putative DNA-binding protein n=1 Tax=Azospirillum baldaniorum TaxID=1064539 RepID=UPI00157A592B|nr:MarR family transcriptional regulator [Azospirillum baldaniorum]NUB04600.1 helix-turn-helix domain-containing protein [Azospirillum baldaniorum]